MRRAFPSRLNEAELHIEIADHENVLAWGDVCGNK